MTCDIDNFIVITRFFVNSAYLDIEEIIHYLQVVLPNQVNQCLPHLEFQEVAALLLAENSRPTEYSLLKLKNSLHRVRLTFQEIIPEISPEHKRGTHPDLLAEKQVPRTLRRHRKPRYRLQEFPYRNINTSKRK